jgi:hypothetical protein
MAGNAEVIRRDLSRQVLRAQCELDRHELRTEIGAVRARVRGTARRAGAALPWVLLAAPLGGLLLARVVRIRRLAGLLVLARAATRLRPWLPILLRMVLSRTGSGRGRGLSGRE